MDQGPCGMAEVSNIGPFGGNHMLIIAICDVKEWIKENSVCEKEGMFIKVVLWSGVDG